MEQEKGGTDEPRRGEAGDLSIFERLESDVRGYCRSFPVVFSRATGPYLYDADDRRYIDFFSGAGTLNYGHNHPRLKRPVIEYLQEDGLLHGLDMATEAKRSFIETFERIILRPREFEYKLQFTGPTGTNAVEAAFKLARKATERTNIVAFTNGFHGLTLGAAAATGNSHFRDAAGIPLTDATFFPYDGYLGGDFDTLDYFEQALKDNSSGLDLPAAVIVETVQGEGGVNVASFQWLRRLERICKEHEILLIVDDIQAGCGRTGTFFSFEPSGINPDIITLSKSLSGYGLPMSLVLLKPELDVWEASEHTGTFRGNNLAFVSATEALKQFWTTGEFSKSIEQKSAIVAKRLEQWAKDVPNLKLEVRGRGLMVGLVCEPADAAGWISEAAFRRGLIIETSGGQGEVVKLLPPLIIDEPILEEGLDLLEEAVREVADSFAPEGSHAEARA